jgi:hypothetical protein
MLVYANLLKRDYKITYTLKTNSDDFNDGMIYTTIMKDCYTQSEAFEKWYDTLEYALDDWDIEPVKKTKQQRINEEVYELVLADLFEGHIGIYEYVDIRNADEYEITEQLEGIERMMIEHEAYNKYVNTL